MRHLAPLNALVLAVPLIAVPLTGGVATAADTPVGAPAATPATPTPGSKLASRFTLATLPDTQFYSRYSTPETGDLFQARYGSRPYETQTQWLVDHQRDLNIPFTADLGDIVDQVDVPGEWTVADKAMKILERGGMHYSILPGNHDMTEDQTNSDIYRQHFPESRAKQNPTFGGRFTHGKKDSEYHIFEGEGQKFLVLAIGWRADDATLDWAQRVIDEHPTLPVILTSHEVTNIDQSGNIFLSEDYGQHLWDKLIKRNDQIFLTIGGHHHGTGYMTKKNDAGHDVVNVLQDYQMAYQGGNGLMGLIQFDLTNNVLDMTALSPWVAIKPHEKLTQFDHVVLDEGTYQVPMNFKDRFSFAPDFHAGTPDDPDYAQRAKDIVQQHYQPPTIPASELPKNDQDFPNVDATVAHWRPGQAGFQDGQKVGAGAVIPDVSGHGNDMNRKPGFADGDITFTKDHHKLSSDTGSLKWTNPGANKLRLNWFETAADAAVNKDDFKDGYTFETFIKIDKDFGDRNAWMGAISRMGKRGDVKQGIPEGSEPPATLAISSLREVQWSNVGTAGNTDGTSNWSSEVPKDEWLHVAIVNDPKKHTIEMFVGGAPILRDVINSDGLATTDAPWLIGASMWEGMPHNAWFGQIGETRISHGPLAKEQWLTARAPGKAGNVEGAGSSLPGSSFPGSTVPAIDVPGSSQ